MSGGTRRQLTPAQQTHILSDIQQHQHRFSSQNQLLHPPSKTFGQKPSNVVVEPAVQSQLPTETTIVQLPQQSQFFFNQPQSPSASNRFRQGSNLRPSELHTQHHTQTNFVPNFIGQQSQHVAFPQQPLFERNPLQPPQQQLFQRSVANQQGDAHHSFKPSQPFPVQPQPSLTLPSPGNPDPFLQSNFVQPQAPVQTLQQNQLFQNQLAQQSLSSQFLQSQIGVQSPLNGLTPPLQSNQFQQFQNSQIKFGQPQTNPSVFSTDGHADEQRLKEIIEKQKLIQKHEQFVQRQYQKHQQKVQQLHQEFLQKQRRIKEQSIVNAKHRPINNFFPQQTRGRLVSPYETGVFEQAVKNYQETHPTQPTAPPTTTTLSVAATNRIKSSRSNIKGDISEDELERLLANHRDKIFSQLKQDADKSPKKAKVKPTKAYGREDLLKQLKLALADQPTDLGGKNYTTMDLVLPDGQKVQVIRTTDPNLVKGATALNEDGSILSEVSPQQLISQGAAEPKPLLDEVADTSILPPGANFEVIRQSADGGLQPIESLPNKKKVTFVYLEEQTDGSFKVQGVKSNGDKVAKTSGTEVDSIINRINNGEIQLPSASTGKTASSAATTKATVRTIASSPSPSTAFSSLQFESSTPSTRFISSVTPSPSVSFVSSASPYSTIPTIVDDQTIGLTASPSTHYPSTTPRSLPSRSAYTTRGVSTSFPETNSPILTQSSSASTLSQVHTHPTNPSSDQQSELVQILKSNGLHAMAKYLRQSGLDSILNETGPYTVFAPSDKAFKSLLVQLGGPDRAEEKFKSNPRLLSGVSI